jgi:hypothetical protein
LTREDKGRDQHSVLFAQLHVLDFSILQPQVMAVIGERSLAGSTHSNAQEKEDASAPAFVFQAQHRGAEEAE